MCYVLCVCCVSCFVCVYLACVAFGLFFFFWVGVSFILFLGLGIGFFGDFTAYSVWYAFFFMKYNTNSDYKLAFFVNTLYIIHSISYRFRQVKILQEIVGIFSDDMIGRVESIHGNAWMRRFYKLFKSILRWPQGTVSWEKIIISTYVKDEIVLS